MRAITTSKSVFQRNTPPEALNVSDQLTSESTTKPGSPRPPLLKQRSDSSVRQQIKQEWEDCQKTTARADSENDPNQADSGEFSEDMQSAVFGHAEPYDRFFAASSIETKTSPRVLTTTTTTTTTTTATTATTATTNASTATTAHRAPTTTAVLSSSQIRYPSVFSARDDDSMSEKEKFSPEPGRELLSSSAEANDHSSENFPGVVVQPSHSTAQLTSAVDEMLSRVKDFLFISEATELTIPLDDPSDYRIVKNFLFEAQKEKIVAMPGKEVFLQVNQATTDVKSLFTLFQELSDSELIGGLELIGDPVINTWKNLKSSLHANTNITKLQFSKSGSDAVCGWFKTWLSYQAVSAAPANSTPSIQSLSFAALQISDMAVFAAVLREMITKMPNLIEVDFSKTQLSDEQRQLLHRLFQSIGRGGLLKF